MGLGVGLGLMGRLKHAVGVASLAGLSMVALASLAPAQSMEPSATKGWVRLPAEGATFTDAYAVVENPTMYAFYVMKASADVAGTVELGEAGKDTPPGFLTVPAYGSLDMEAEGVHLRLKSLKKPLAEGDTVILTLVNELGLEFRLEAKVRRPEVSAR